MFTVPETDETLIAHKITQGAGVDHSDLIDDTKTETFTANSWTESAITNAAAPVMSAPDLFTSMGITAAAHDVSQYVYGDNIDGYYDGRTNSFSAESRYIMKSSAIYMYFISLTDGVLNNKLNAAKSVIYPYGVRTCFCDTAWDEFVLHDHDHAITLSAHSDTAKNLGLLPKLNLTRCNTVFEKSGNVLVFSPKDESAINTANYNYLAIACDKACSYVGADPAAYTDLQDVGGICAYDIKPVFTTNSAETDFRMVIGFGKTKAEAIAKAQSLVVTDTVGIQKQAVYDLLTKSYFWTANDIDYCRALMWAKFSANSMVVEEIGRGIWAGLPWFKDNWGRDTFISLPGTLLVNGQFDVAKAVIQNFASLQNTDSTSANYGRIPNRVTGTTDIIYNTVDGTPWMIREIYEYIRYTGDTAFAEEMYPVIERYIEGTIAKGHVDAEGFLTHASADTWMDAKFNAATGAVEYGYTDGSGLTAWSPRGNRAVEIQALWYMALKIGVLIANKTGNAGHAADWTTRAGKVESNFLPRFWDGTKHVMADKITSDNVRDTKVRPNQLMLVSIPFEDRFVTNEVEADIVKNAIGELLFQYGITSLSQNHLDSKNQSYFHPYHDNQSTYHKDAAYHNGTIWGWNAGPAVTAMTRFGYVERAYEFSQNLAGQILNQGCRGSMSECLDAFKTSGGKLIQSGTFSQAWSVAEYARNGYQDFAGFRPDLTASALELCPSIPSVWNAYDSVFRFGCGAAYKVNFIRGTGIETFTVSFSGYDSALTLNFSLELNKVRYQVSVPSIASGTPVVVVFSTTDHTATVNGSAAAVTVGLSSYESTIGTLPFATPNLSSVSEYDSIKTKDFLKGIIANGTYE
jgi:glycogen debranching enzyme